MRRFSSYGPVDPRVHFCVPRTDLIAQCVSQLVGDPGVGGHYFTVYGARQTGKTWVMRQAVEAVRRQFGDRFEVLAFSVQGLMGPNDGPDVFLKGIGERFPRQRFPVAPTFESWADWLRFFKQGQGPFERPVVLVIDEFDSLTADVMDRLVSLFREMYLAGDDYLLHSLALVGVRAVLGVDSPRGSPFNVQRSLQIPNFTREEVGELFRQYQEESGQGVAPDVVAAVYEAVRGQPGLTCWFGELLTEKYNDAKPEPITLAQWEDVYVRALYLERNNNILNLVAKARGPYAREVQTLFVRNDVPYAAGQPWCDYLELNGIIAPEPNREPGGPPFVCRFSSPFVQRRLFQAFTHQMAEALADVPALDGADMMEDVFTPEGLNVPALLERYKAYLDRLRARGRDPFRDQPLRADFQLPEAVGHFHLYAWLLQAVGGECAITPEFPTGNGKVDLRMVWEGKVSLLEVKSLGAGWELARARVQAARYARQQGLAEATLVVFLPTERPEELSRFEGSEAVDGVTVHVVPIGWRA